jgi:hypothetical protein
MEFFTTFSTIFTSIDIGLLGLFHHLVLSLLLLEWIDPSIYFAQKAEKES